MKIILTNDSPQLSGQPVYARLEEKCAIRVLCALNVCKLDYCCKDQENYKLCFSALNHD